MGGGKCGVPGLSEKEIERGILNFLQSHPSIIKAWRNDTDRTITRKYAKGSHRGKGLPDICGMFRGGEFFCIEVKKPGGKVTPEQTEFLRSITLAGGSSLLAFSMEEVKLWLEEKLSKRSSPLTSKTVDTSPIQTINL